MVGVVGGPAEGQLGKVARAHHEAALLVGHVHEDLRALAGLRILVGDGVIGLVVPDVGEVLTHGGGDGNLAQLAAQRPAHGERVAVRAVRRAEARHGDGKDARAVKPQQVEGTCGDEQRKRGVKPARDADDSPLAVRVGKSLGKAVSLDRKDLLAALGAAGRIAGDEGVRVHIPRDKRRLSHAQREGYDDEAPVLGRGSRDEGGHATTVRRKQLHVDDGRSGSGRMALPRPCERGVVERHGLGKHAAVLAHEVVTAKDKVLRGLAPPGACVQVGADKPGARSAHKGAPVVGLAHELVGGRQVAHERGASLGEGGRGRLGHPQVLADLDGNHELGQLVAGKEQVRAKGHLPVRASGRQLRQAQAREGHPRRLLGAR